MSVFRPPTPAAFGVVFLAFVGCDDHVLHTNPQPSGVFLADVLEVIDHNCITCHAGVTAEAGLDLSTDFCANVNGRIVVPGEPDLSLLYLRMRSPSEPMPPTGRLPTADIEVVRTWIADGAECEGATWSGPTDTGEQGEPGKQLYDSYCAGCHGATGGGGSGPALTAVVPGLTAEEVATIARSGSGGMPPVLANPDDALTVGEWVVQEYGN